MTSIDVTQHEPAAVRHRRGRLAVALVALLVATFAPTLPAQAADLITISGRVTDQSDRPIAGLAVMVVPSGGGQAQTTTTRAESEARKGSKFLTMKTLAGTLPPTLLSLLLAVLCEDSEPYSFSMWGVSTNWRKSIWQRCEPMASASTA